MKKALRRNKSAVRDMLSLRIRFPLPVICNTAKLKAVSVAGYDAFIIGLSSLSSSSLNIMLNSFKLT
jgi:hypothetical protein